MFFSPKHYFPSAIAKNFHVLFIHLRQENKVHSGWPNINFQYEILLECCTGICVLVLKFGPRHIILNSTALLV